MGRDFGEARRGRYGLGDRARRGRMMRFGQPVKYAT